MGVRRTGEKTAEPMNFHNFASGGSCFLRKKMEEISGAIKGITELGPKTCPLLVLTNNEGLPVHLCKERTLGKDPLL